MVINDDEGPGAWFVNLTHGHIGRFVLDTAQITCHSMLSIMPSVHGRPVNSLPVFIRIFFVVERQYVIWCVCI
jgi:hypothetical protein